MSTAIHMYLPAKLCGIKLPEDIENYDSKKYPHWYLLTQIAEKLNLLGLSESFNHRLNQAKRVSMIQAHQIINNEIDIDDILMRRV